MKVFFPAHIKIKIGKFTILLLAINKFDSVFPFCGKILYHFTPQNADLSHVPNHEHDESLFLEKREQMCYNVENRDRVDNKYK